MPFPHLKIIKIMRRRNLDRPRSVLRIRVFIRNDRNRPIRQRQLYQPPDNILIPFIFRIDRHRHISKNRLRPRRTYNNLALLEIARIIYHVFWLRYYFIRDIPQFPIFVNMLHLNIRKRRLMLRAKVHQFLPPVDHPIIPHLLKRLIHSRNYILIQRKCQIRPRAACPQRPDL